MRIVALEEHYTHPDLLARVPVEIIEARGFPMPGGEWPPAMRLNQLSDVDDRLKDMDGAGIDLQVLSVPAPGADALGIGSAPAAARAFNDHVAQVVAGGNGRFAAFAHLPMADPEASADELERCIVDLGFRGALINGEAGGRFLDDAAYEPLLKRAESLDVPLYLHPNAPSKPVRDAYYTGFAPPLEFLFATSGWGWHAEVAVHVLRLVLSGTLQRHDRLKIIIGHMGEGLPAMLGRFDDVLSPHVSRMFGRGVSETILDQVWITTAGWFTWPPMALALATFGVDRVMFSVDYPFATNRRARDFLDSMPISPADKAKIAHGNADRLLKLGQ